MIQGMNAKEKLSNTKEMVLKENEAGELLKKGREYFNRGEFQNSQTILNEVIEIDDKNIEALFLLANLFHRKGEIGKAIKSFNRVLLLDPCHTDAAVSLSVLYNDIGKYEEAKKIFDKANERVKSRNSGNLMEDLHINKKFSQKHFEIADLYMTYNRYDEALFEYNKATHLDPDNLEARVKVAKVYAKKGFMGKAFEELRKVKNEAPNYPPARIALGILHYGNGNILDAQTEWEKILAKEPGNKEAAMYINLSKTATETSLTSQ